MIYASYATLSSGIPLINIHLMYLVPRETVFFFPESPDVSRDEIEGNVRTRGKTKQTSFPRDHILSVLLYI